jgi:integrase
MSKSNTVKTWSKTRLQGLMRHKSGRYYARLFTGGKEKWISLETNLFEVAKNKMGSDASVNDIRKSQSNDEKLKTGKLLIKDLLELYKTELAQRISIKGSTRKFWLENLALLLKSWPELETLEVRKVTENDCRKWAANFAQDISPSYFNNSIISLKRIFEVALKAGAIYRNPANVIERKKERKKKLTLPSRQQFSEFVRAIQNAQHRTSQDSADLVELLAYTGCRISEARRLEWQDVDFEKGEILVKGDPDTGTKNWEMRRVPILPACLDLLKRIKANHPNNAKTTLIAKVGDARGSMTKAAKTVGMAYISHHDLRHLFATICIESGVDIPTVSRWLGHKDGGALAMKTYGHLRREHSIAQAQRVSFAPQ